jgi:hypothetical protein
MKQYTIGMTCSGGSAIAGNYITNTKRKALAMAKKEHGDEWTYYIHEEKKIGLEGRHYFIARYWNDADNQLEVFPEYKKQIKYGTEKSADVELTKIIKKSKNDCWQIFWINTDRDERKTPESVRADIEAKGKELEHLKETDYAAWVDYKNDN